MKKWFGDFLEEKNKVSLYLVLANISLMSFLIIANNFGLIPLRIGDFVFFIAITLSFFLYRPSWGFLFFIGTIVLENANLAPQNLKFIIRPYQFFGGLLFFALIIRFFSRKLYLKLPKLNHFDFLPFLIPLGAFLALFISANKFIDLKLIIILVSFYTLYLIVKVYIQDWFDLKKVLPFIFSSSLVVIFYGLWQNMRFMHKLNSFEVMPGRPNSTFFEADWLGMYLLLLLSAIYALIYYLNEYSGNLKKRVLAYGYLCLIFIILIISVSRSAWLGAFIMTIIYFLYVFTKFKFNFRLWSWKSILQIKLGVLFVFIISIAMIYFFKLTDFQLANRVKSTGTGLQKITVSCFQKIKLPEKINTIKELDKFNCRHINLEDIDLEKSQNKIIMEIYRTDPNINTRAEIYRKAGEQIRQHPLVGIGFGNIASILGQGGRGEALNASNIFLEIYLGSGILGFLAFVIFLGYVFFLAISNIWLKETSTQEIFGLFVLLSGVGIVIFNLFNTGLMLGIFWVWLAISNSLKIKKI